MGACIGEPKDPGVQILKKAYSTFKKIDVNKNKQIAADDLEKYFGSYSAASAKILMREVDLDKDGVISLNEWMGYWEMVRRAGYRYPEIMRELNNIDNGQLTLNFPNTNSYQQDLPRSTVVNTIVDDLKRSPPQNLPFFLQNQNKTR